MPSGMRGSSLLALIVAEHVKSCGWKGKRVGVFPLFLVWAVLYFGLHFCEACDAE